MGKKAKRLDAQDKLHNVVTKIDSLSMMVCESGDSGGPLAGIGVMLCEIEDQLREVQGLIK